MIESVVLCEGYHDRAFWAAWLLQIGCTDPGQREAGRRVPVNDPWGRRVEGGQFGFHSRSEQFVRIVPCQGRHKVLRMAHDRLADRVDHKLRLLVVSTDADVDAGGTQSGQGPALAAVRTVLERHGRYQTTEEGDFQLADGARIVIPQWQADDPDVDGVPMRQTLERLVCSAVVAAHPPRGAVVKRWLDSRPDGPEAGPKEFAWSHMAGWYARFGCEGFYRAIWQDEPVRGQLQSRLETCGAWRIGDLLAR